MEPPAALVLDRLAFPTVTLIGDSSSRSEDGGVLQIVAYDEIYLTPRVRRFLNAYLDADALRRADFRKATAFASRRFGFDSAATSTFQEDIAAALSIAQEAAAIADATDSDEMIDSYSADSDLLLLADALAVLAFAYRYVVGLYATDPTLGGDLGEVAVRFVLLAEREHDSELAATAIAFPLTPSITAYRANQEFESNLANFVPATAVQDEVVVSSLEAIYQQPKEPVLLIA